MHIIGIDISKAKFDAALLVGERARHAAFSNTEAGFAQLLACVAKQGSDPDAPKHACMEATGNWGLDLAAFLHGQGVQVSIVNPARIKAYGSSELARNKTDQLDAALIARFCRAQSPPAWTPPAAHLRELRELVRPALMLKQPASSERIRDKLASPSRRRSPHLHRRLSPTQIRDRHDTALYRRRTAGPHLAFAGRHHRTGFQDLAHIPRQCSISA